MMTTTIKYFFHQTKTYGSHFFGKNRVPCKNRIFEYLKNIASLPLLKITNHSKISGRPHVKYKNQSKTDGNHPR